MFSPADENQALELIHRDVVEVQIFAASVDRSSVRQEIIGVILGQLET